MTTNLDAAAGLPANPSTLVGLLRGRALHQAEHPAYTFLEDGGATERLVTFSELDRQSRAIAAWLQSLGARGERALLLYPPGLDFIAAFFGCLYAGVVAVPAYPPRLNRPMPRLQAIVTDSQATIGLTVTSVLANLERRFEHEPHMAVLQWLNTETLPAGVEVDWRETAVTTDTLAFLQYTSGSTSTPKGVMLSHGNLMHNLAVIRRGFRIYQAGWGVFWLPSYHDMGLIGGVLEPMYVNRPSALMSPASFLQRPVRWLDAISRHPGAISGAPNFAYELCVEKVTPEQRESLDLSTWQVAFCGAEPVRRETLERFVETFAPCGFHREALYPCYGLAEATLLVSGSDGPAAPIYHTVHRAALHRHRAVAATAPEERAQTLVSNGHALLGQRIVIANPETSSPCASDEVGEIWVAGASVAQGYWNRPEETQFAFNARLAGTNEGPFLRTGDLGFLQEGELFVTGRMKDLIIIHGRNHYPQDIERTVEQSHPALQSGGGAAFAVETDGQGEQLAIVQELTRQGRNANIDEVTGAIRRAVAEHHELQVQTIVIVKPTSIPKTSSGKVQRFACRDQFLEGTLEVIGEWRAESGTASSSAPPAPTASTRSATEIEAWLVHRLAHMLNLAPYEIDPRQPFAYYGIGSVQAVGLAGELAEWLGGDLSPTLAYDYPTIESAARYLAGDDRPGRADGELPTTDDIQSSPSPHRSSAADPIAIIGMGCRFPGADGYEAFWRLLRDGADAVAEVPAERWDLRALYDPDPAAPGRMNTRWGGFLKQIDHFDAPFFKISPREAARMDPQQRLLLEVAWEALEDAGLDAERLAGSLTGVFVGVSTFDYGQLALNDAFVDDPYAVTGSALSVTANRLSYVFDLRGPSLAVDTACSSSLVALHLACRSLWNGDASLALVGGVNLMLSPAITVNFTKAGLMAPDGRCKAFDARANGYVRGEGAGVVVLKPLARALADGDSIHAVILGSAVNHDGRTNGLLAPSGAAQEAVLREAYRQAGVPPQRVQYVEAHGTGTYLGDPIEAKSLAAVLTADRPPDCACAIGSVKSNIGHLEAAAGIAGLIKVALALKHRAIPPSLHFHEPNPLIPFERLGLRVQQSQAAWPEHSGPALAGVSSFGFGGTNAHVVLQEAPAPAATRTPEARPASATTHLLPLSAHNPKALRDLAEAYVEFLSASPSATSPPLRDICYTAGARRGHHDHRLAIVGRSHQEAVERLRAYLQGEARPGLSAGRRVPGQRPKIVFVFPGQGSQWPGMGRELIEREAVFRAAVEQCDRAMRPHVDWSLLEELAADERRSRLNEIDVVQPALFAIQVGLAALWRSWGVEPLAVVGQSMGEVAAAYVAGALRLEDAARIICRRSRLLRRTSGRGAMAAVELSLDQARAAIAGYEDRVSIAVSSGPTSTVLSGDPGAIQDLIGSLERQDVACRLINVDVASHSPQMDSLRGDLLQALDGLQPQPASIPIYSTVVGGQSDGLPLDADYWVRNLREPVLFAPAVQKLLKAGYDVFLEISPHPILLNPIRQALYHAGGTGVLIPSLRRAEGERAAMLESLGALYAHGWPLDWRKLYPEAGRIVRLPSYPWQRERYPLPTSGPAPGRAGLPAEGGVGADDAPGIEDWLYEVEWRPQSREAGRSRSDPSSGAPAGPWLIFADQGGVGKALAERLAARAEKCIFVLPGEAFARPDATEFRIRPADLGDMRRLFAAALGSGEPALRGVVHLWSLDTGPLEETTAASLVSARGLNCVSTLHLIQELARVGWTDRPRLWLATTGAQAVTGSGAAVAVAQAPLWGLGRVVAQEHPGLWGGLLDLDPEAQSGEAADALAEEVTAPQDEDQIAFRQGRRFAARLSRMRELPAPAAPLPLRTDASYLITGGLGDLGLLVARWLVDQGARRLILLARTKLPARSHWSDAELGSRLADQVAAIRDLEARGASVHQAAVDVADEAQLASFLAEYQREGWPPIRGVVHAAGLAHIQPLAHLDAAALEADWRPKAAGGWLLHRLLEEAPLDFFVMFSSMATLLNSPLLGSYASANAFLDALAHLRRAQGRPALTVNWGFWANVGLAARELRQTGRVSTPRGVGAFTPRQGLAVLGRLMRGEWTQAGVIPVNWDEWRQYHPAASQAPVLADLMREATAVPSPGARTADYRDLTRAMLLAADPAERRRLLEGHFREQVARVLRMPPARLELDQPLNNLGIDSLMAVELKNQIEVALGVVVPIVKLLRGPTVAGLAALVLDLLEAQETGRTSPAAAVAPVAEADDGWRRAADRIGQQEAAHLLARLDELTDEEMNSLLDDLAAEEQANE